MTPVKREPPSLKRRGSKNLPPEKLYDLLLGLYPEELADEKFEHLMGYPPPYVRGQKKWLKLNLEEQNEK